jgi:hypothetical protein
MVIIEIDLDEIQIRLDFCSPTTVQWWVFIIIEDYGWKESNVNICGLSAARFCWVIDYSGNPKPQQVTAHGRPVSLLNFVHIH